MRLESKTTFSLRGTGTLTCLNRVLLVGCEPFHVENPHLHPAKRKYWCAGWWCDALRHNSSTNSMLHRFWHSLF